MGRRREATKFSGLIRFFRNLRSDSDLSAERNRVGRKAH
jgi:hypothetical protein